MLAHLEVLGLGCSVHSQNYMVNNRVRNLNSQGTEVPTLPRIVPHDFPHSLFCSDFSARKNKADIAEAPREEENDSLSF